MSQTVRVTLDMTEAPLTVDAFPTPVPGLVIHHAPGQDGGDWWSITHVASGGAVSSYLPSPEAALGCAIDLGRLADWTLPMPALRGQVLGVSDALTRWAAGSCPASQMHPETRAA